ncbi:MAG: hypothetical protein ACHQ2F_05500 [Desulfobaccales bacterium]
MAANNQGTMGPKKPGTMDPSEYAVVLPCKPGDFKDFVSSLLGKPQTITKVFHAPFEIKPIDVENFYYIVDQRINQQNEASLLQFTIKVIYDDNSSVILNSLADFIHYNEIRTVSSIAAHLTWTYLVRFQDKTAAEKQMIEVSIISSSKKPFFDEDITIPFFLPVNPFNLTGFINFRISHTARTWGADIEALLTEHIKNLLKNESKIKSFIIKNNDKIGIGVGISLFIGAIIGAFTRFNSFVKHQGDLVNNIIPKDMDQFKALIAKIDYLLNFTTSGTWEKFNMNIGTFLLISGVFSIIFGSWAAIAANNRELSFLLLTRESEKRKKEMLKKNRRTWLSFIGSLLFGIITSVVGNILFIYFFK